MNTTQSIIIYRNPLEQAFWESGMVFPLMVSLVVFMVVFLSIYKIMEFFVSWKVQRSNLYTFVAGALALGAMFLTLWSM